MKKIIYLILFISSISNAQVAIGKTTIEGSNTLLDFNSTLGNTKGIILPSIINIANLETVRYDNPLTPGVASHVLENGTFIFDYSEGKVKVRQNNVWKDLNTDPGNTSSIIMNSSSDIGLGTIIGSDTSTAIGALILESPNKAMILPKIANPHLNVKSPYPGMICYDSVSKSLAVFDGTNWSYWK